MNSTFINILPKNNSKMQIEVKRTTKIPSFNYILDTRTLFSTVLTITNAEHLSEVNKARQSPLSPGDECELLE